MSHTSAPKPTITVVVPVYNEADNIAALTEEVHQALSPTFAYELLFVDDASTDNTLKNIQALLPQYPQLTYRQHPRNAGQSAAIVTGVKAARHPLIATLDGDGQNCAADILTLYQKWSENPTSNHACLGWRTRRQDSRFKRFSSKVANAVRACLLRDHSPDTGCGIKLFSKALFLSIPHFRNCHRFLPALFKREGAHLSHVPVSHRVRQHGYSKYGLHNRLWVGIIDLIGVAWLMRRKLTTPQEQP